MNNLINFIKHNEVLYRGKKFFKMELDCEFEQKETIENKRIIKEFNEEIERKKEDFKNFNFSLLEKDRKVFYRSSENNKLKSIFIYKELYLGFARLGSITDFYLKAFDFENNQEIRIVISKERDTFFFSTQGNRLVIAIDNEEMKNWGIRSVYCLNKINIDKIDRNFELKQFSPFIIFFIIFLLFLSYQGLKFALISLSFMIPALLAVYSKLFTKEVFLEKYEASSFREMNRY